MKKIIFLFFLLPSLVFSQDFQEHPHPFYYTRQRINTAKANIEKFDWARELQQEIFQSADEAAALSDDELRSWFSPYTPISQCDCPYCNHHWQDYVWAWSPSEPDQMVCNHCGGITSMKHFPENDSIYVYAPTGEITPHPVYRDSSGKIYPIRELVFYYKNRYAYAWIKNLGIAYALGEKINYAHKAAVLLKRLAEVYPGFAIHDNFRFERYPFGWAGKLRMWHYTDAYTLQDCAATYDAIYHSGALNQTDKAVIEADLFETGVNFLTSVRPSQGISNDMAFRYAGVAMLGRTLERHDAIAWVLDPEEGYKAFIDKLFFRDGVWHERAPGYHRMAVRPLHETVEILQGYSDPPSYQQNDRFDDIDLTTIEKLGTIFSATLDMRFPDGTLPPVNDCRMGGTPDGTPLEALYNWTKNDRWLKKANHAYGGNLLQTGNLYALFNRPPDIDRKQDLLSGALGIPDNSQDFTGMGLFMLRRGRADDQVVFTLHHHKYSSGHTHYDALSTILWANGREMLSDFGYPSFSSPLRSTWYLTSLSHNTLTVDTKKQFAPNGVANWLHHGELFSACEAESWESYRYICEPFMRQIALIETGDEGIYAVDIFRGDGGSIHDWALHGEGDTLVVKNVNLQPQQSLEGCDYAYQHLTAIKAGNTEKEWQAQWHWTDNTILTCYFPAMTNSTVYKALTPGQRLNSMKGRQKYAVIQRRRGQNLRSEFAGVYVPGENPADIKKVEKIYVSSARDWAVVLKITRDKSIDYVLSSYLDISAQPGLFTDGNITIDWQSRFGVVRVQNGGIVQQEWVKGVMEGLRHDM
ncbi:hypothetical protein GF407_12220 [candidate division KSB1 bacterium]|nr:hypothetical protein [candidate division KSB1 bacterium]